MVGDADLRSTGGLPYDFRKGGFGCRDRQEHWGGRVVDQYAIPFSSSFLFSKILITEIDIATGRLLRTLTASGFVTEYGDGLYGATPYTKHPSQRQTVGTIKFLFDFYVPLQGKAPGFL
ncbi:S-adenosyl-L-methionine-dependent methyltransferase [Apiospora saccharicola]|uniref:S-adenosyl-L-methionine-dependent methyltransferase n=1 Tax=Apiospora saccharicola TaxID=335842 RepID=A0ABR1UXD3_9PEZI